MTTNLHNLSFETHFAMFLFKLKSFLINRIKSQLNNFNILITRNEGKYIQLLIKHKNTKKSLKNYEYHDFFQKIIIFFNSYFIY